MANIIQDEIFKNHYNVYLEDYEIDNFRKLYKTLYNIILQIQKVSGQKYNNSIGNLVYLCDYMEDIVKRCSGVSLKKELKVSE